MKIDRVPYQLQILNDGPPRSIGVHCSDIIRDLSFRGGILNKKYENSDMVPEIIELGIAWEERLFKHHIGLIVPHPGEMKVDGISMSMDGASFNDDETSIFFCDGDGALHEFKYTRKSSNRDLSAEFQWLTQVKCYLYGMNVTGGGKKFDTAFLHVMWANGNYSRDFSNPKSNPTYEIWKLQFTPLELKECWQMIKNHAQRMYGSSQKVNIKKGK